VACKLGLTARIRMIPSGARFASEELTMTTKTLELNPVTTRLSPQISTLLLQIQSEYGEMPGLKLTEAQARRLWHLDSNTCSFLLTTLLEKRFLKRTASGTYVRACD